MCRVAREDGMSVDRVLKRAAPHEFDEDCTRSFLHLPYRSRCTCIIIILASSSKVGISVRRRSD
jgi:hypothetical protein